MAKGSAETRMNASEVVKDTTDSSEETDLAEKTELAAEGERFGEGGQVGEGALERRHQQGHVVREEGDRNPMAGIRQEP